MASERAAAVHLAAAGVRVALGSPFRPGRPQDGDYHIRVTFGLVRTEVDAVGALLAQAARA